MRILITTTDYLPNISGIATLAFEQARGLAALGHQVCLLTTTTGASTHNSNGDFEVHERQGKAPPVFRLAHLFRTLASTCNTFKPDFVWCVNYRGFGLPVFLEARRRRLPYGIYIHGTELITESKSRIRHRILNAVLNRASLVCTNSQFTSSLVRSLYGHSSNPVTPGVHLVPDEEKLLQRAMEIRNSWLAAKSIHGTEKRIIFISSCRIAGEKGLGTVIKALSLLESEHRSRTLYIMGGSGPAVEEYKKQSAMLGISDTVIFTGFAERNEMTALFKAADVYLQPSQPHGDYIEGFGISFLEAQAAGLPCIASDWCGIPEAVKPDLTGLLVTPASPEAIAEAVRKVLTDPNWRTVAGQEGKAWAAYNTWKRHANKLNSLITEAVPGKPSVTQR